MPSAYTQELKFIFVRTMPAAIEAGLESAPIGVITTPGTRKPKYVSGLAARSLRETQPFLGLSASQPSQGHLRTVNLPWR
jgi:hypothetical protein